MKKNLLLCFALFASISWGASGNDDDIDTQPSATKICLTDYKNLTQQLSDASIRFHDIRLPIESALTDLEDKIDNPNKEDLLKFLQAILNKADVNSDIIKRTLYQLWNVDKPFTLMSCCSNLHKKYVWMKDFLADTLFQKGVASQIMEEYRSGLKGGPLKFVDDFYQKTVKKDIPISSTDFLTLLNSALIYLAVLNPQDQVKITSILMPGGYTVQDLSWILASIALQANNNTNEPKILYLPFLQNRFITIQSILAIRQLAEGKNWTLDHYQHVFLALDRLEPQKQKSVIEIIKKLSKNKDWNYNCYSSIINELSEMETYSENSLNTMLKLTDNQDYGFIEYLTLLHLSTFTSLEKEQAIYILKLLSRYDLAMRKSIFSRISSLSKGQNWSTDMYLKTIESFSSIPRNWHERACRAINNWPLKNDLSPVGHSNLLRILSFFENEIDVKIASSFLFKLEKLNSNQMKELLDVIKTQGMQLNLTDKDYKNLMEIASDFLQKSTPKNNFVVFKRMMEFLNKYNDIKNIDTEKVKLFLTTYLFDKIKANLDNLIKFLHFTYNKDVHFVRDALNKIDTICKEKNIEVNKFIDNCLYFEINHLSELDYVDKATEERYVNPSQKMSPKIVYYVSKIYENFYHYKNGKCRKEIKNHLDIMMQLKAQHIDPSLDISFLQFVELHSIPEVKTISKIFNLISNTYQNDKQLCLCILEFLNKEIKASHDALEILECMKKMSGLSCEKIRLIQQQIEKGSNFLRKKEGYVYSKGPLFQFFYLFTNNKENNIRYDSLFVFIKQLDTIYKFTDGPADLRVNLLNNVIKAFEGADMTMSDAYNFAKHLDQDFQMQGYCNSLYGSIKNGKYFRYLRDKNKAKKFIEYFLLPKFKFLAWIAKNYKNQSAFCLKLYDKFKSNIQGANHTEAYRNLERNENVDLCKIHRHDDLRAQNPINFLEYCKEFIRDILGISPNDDFYNNGVDMDDFFAPAINDRTWTLCLHRSFFNSPYTEAILHFKYWLGIEKVDEELFTACTKYWNNFYENMKKK